MHDMKNQRGGRTTSSVSIQSHVYPLGTKNISYTCAIQFPIPILYLDDKINGLAPHMSSL